MPSKTNTKQKNIQQTERDSTYFLKLVIYIMLGLFWVHLNEPVQFGSFTIYGIPVGLFVGLLIASHDHFQVDRKMEYAVLLVMTVVGFVIPYLGIYV